MPSVVILPMPPDCNARRSYWIPGSYVPTWSENRHSFLRPWKKKGVSHLLHTWWPRHLRALLYKRCNVEGEILDCLIDLNIVLPGGGRPDAVVVFLQPS